MEVTRKNKSIKETQETLEVKAKEVREDSTELKELKSLLKEQGEKLQKLENKDKVAPIVDKRGHLLKPKHAATELSKFIPRDDLFNKTRQYNTGTTNNPINIIEKVDCIHFHINGSKYTFWKNLAVTKAQIVSLEKSLGKEKTDSFIKNICV